MTCSVDHPQLGDRGCCIGHLGRTEGGSCSAGFTTHSFCSTSVLPGRFLQATRCRCCPDSGWLPSRHILPSLPPPPELCIILGSATKRVIKREISVGVMKMCCILIFNMCGIKFVSNLCSVFWILVCVDYVCGIKSIYVNSV
jgi:hypothetical protein